MPKFDFNKNALVFSRKLDSPGTTSQTNLWEKSGSFILTVNIGII